MRQNYTVKHNYSNINIINIGALNVKKERKWALVLKTRTKQNGQK